MKPAVGRVALCAAVVVVVVWFAPIVGTDDSTVDSADDQVCTSSADGDCDQNYADSDNKYSTNHAGFHSSMNDDEWFVYALYFQMRNGSRI